MKVSVIIPAYNSEKWIERAIKSVMDQRYQNYELIIVDDCSIDNTYKIIQKYANDPKVKICRLSVNSGVSVARNAGLELCDGDIVIFLDSDDEFIPDALDTIIKKFKSLPEDVGIIYARTINDNGEVGGDISGIEHYITIIDVLCKEIIKGEAAIAFKRKFMDNLKFHGKFFHHSSSFNLKIMMRTKAYSIPTILLKYHNLTNPKSLTKIKRNIYLRMSSSHEIAKEISDYLAVFGDILKIYCPKKYSSINLQLGIYALLANNRKLALEGFIESLRYYPYKSTIIWMALIFLPIGLIRQLYLRLFSK
ncbi:MAG: glycosyltransferase family 2 protein [Thermoproteota archaeon]